MLLSQNGCVHFIITVHSSGPDVSNAAVIVISQCCCDLDDGMEAAKSQSALAPSSRLFDILRKWSHISQGYTALIDLGLPGI